MAVIKFDQIQKKQPIKKKEPCRITVFAQRDKPIISLAKYRDIKFKKKCRPQNGGNNIFHNILLKLPQQPRILIKIHCEQEQIHIKDSRSQCEKILHHPYPHNIINTTRHTPLPMLISGIMPIMLVMRHRIPLIDKNLELISRKEFQSTISFTIRNSG